MALRVARIAAMAGAVPALWLAAVALEFAAGGLVTWLAGRHGPARPAERPRALGQALRDVA